MKEISEFHFQICIVSDADIKQNDSLIEKAKNEIRVKIKRVSQIYESNKININSKRKVNDYFNLQILYH